MDTHTYYTHTGTFTVFWRPTACDHCGKTCSDRRTQYEQNPSFTELLATTAGSLERASLPDELSWSDELGAAVCDDCWV